MSWRGMLQVFEIWRKLQTMFDINILRGWGFHVNEVGDTYDKYGLQAFTKHAKLLLLSVVSAAISLRMFSTSVRKRRVKWRASMESPSVSSASKEFAVVSGRPGTCGSVRPGRTAVSVMMGIWRERPRLSLRKMWAILDWEMSV